MSQLTRCPNCATTFRVSDAQLALRGGRVRCGHCSFVFNARACLVDADPITVIDIGANSRLSEDEFLQDEPVQPAGARTETVVKQSDPLVEEASALLEELDELPPPSWLRQPSEHQRADARAEDVQAEVADRSFPSLPDAEPDAPEESPAVENVTEKRAVAPAARSNFEHSDFVPPSKIRSRSTERERAKRSRKKARRRKPHPVAAVQGPDDSWLKPTGLSPWRWLWRLGYLALMLSATAIAAVLFRQPLVQHYPAARPWLMQACARIGCTVPAPRNADLLVLDGVEFSFDPEQPDVLELNGVLRNNATFDQTWPLLDVQLLDAQGRRVARRFISPAHYLSVNERAWNEFPAQTEVPLAIRMTLTGLTVENYRVMVFYP